MLQLLLLAEDIRVVLDEDFGLLPLVTRSVICGNVIKKYTRVSLSVCTDNEVLRYRYTVWSHYQYIPWALLLVHTGTSTLYQYKEVSQSMDNKVCRDKFCTESVSDKGASLSELYR
jgi:hypothetical protein